MQAPYQSAHGEREALEQWTDTFPDDVHLENGKANPHVVGILILYMNVLRLSFRGKLESYA